MMQPARKLATELRFYVYALATPAGRIFYVGKGTGRRAQSHRRANTEAGRIIRELEAAGLAHQTLILFRSDNEADVLERERHFIRLLDPEPLVNVTDNPAAVRAAPRRTHQQPGASPPEAKAPAPTSAVDEALRPIYRRLQELGRQALQEERAAAPAMGTQEQLETSAAQASAVESEPIDALSRQIDALGAVMTRAAASWWNGQEDGAGLGGAT